MLIRIFLNPEAYKQADENSYILLLHFLHPYVLIKNPLCYNNLYAWLAGYIYYREIIFIECI